MQKLVIIMHVVERSIECAFRASDLPVTALWCVGCGRCDCCCCTIYTFTVNVILTTVVVDVLAQRETLFPFLPLPSKKGYKSEVIHDTSFFRLVRVYGKMKNGTSFLTTRTSFDASSSFQGQQQNSYESRKTRTSRKNTRTSLF
jgi:hypothetical protein